MEKSELTVAEKIKLIEDSCFDAQQERASYEEDLKKVFKRLQQLEKDYMRSLVTTLFVFLVFVVGYKTFHDQKIETENSSKRFENFNTSLLNLDNLINRQKKLILILDEKQKEIVQSSEEKQFQTNLKINKLEKAIDLLTEKLVDTDSFLKDITKIAKSAFEIANRAEKRSEETKKTTREIKEEIEKTKNKIDILFDQIKTKSEVNSNEIKKLRKEISKFLNKPSIPQFPTHGPCRVKGVGGFPCGGCPIP